MFGYGLALHALSLLFCIFINTTAYQLGRYEHSSPIWSSTARPRDLPFSQSPLILFQVWVLLSAYLAEYIFFVIVIIVSINFVIFIKVYFSLEADPILASIYSLTFPLISLSFTNESKQQLLDNSRFLSIPFLSDQYCKTCFAFNTTAVKLRQDFDAWFEVVHEFSSGHICTCFPRTGSFSFWWCKFVHANLFYTQNNAKYCPLLGFEPRVAFNCFAIQQLIVCTFYHFNFSPFQILEKGVRTTYQPWECCTDGFLDIYCCPGT